MNDIFQVDYLPEKKRKRRVNSVVFNIYTR